MENSKNKMDISRREGFRCACGRVFTNDPRKIQDGTALDEAKYHFSLEVGNCVDMNTTTAVHSIYKEDVIKEMFEYLIAVVWSYEMRHGHFQSQAELCAAALKDCEIVEWNRVGNSYQRKISRSAYEFLCDKNNF